MPILAPPTHLSLFFTDPESGNPVPRLPMYAELACPRLVPARPRASAQLLQPIVGAIEEIAPTTGAQRDRIASAILSALGQALDDESLDQLRQDSDRARILTARVLDKALHRAGVGELSQIPDARLAELLLEVIREQAVEMGLRLHEPPSETGFIWAEPLGVLSTDHMGYVSFDLTHLRPDVKLLLTEAIEAKRKDTSAESKIAVLIHPYGQPAPFEVMSQARFAFDAIVARLEVAWHTLPQNLINMGPRALQNPSLTDWRLSPASFAASPKTLVGADGCEELVPANLALHQFVLRQVVRLTDRPAEFGVPNDPDLKAAYIDEYKVSWYALGHSLGEILYSLPLAPGETARLAVVDWSWDSLTKRDETTKLTEDVLHKTHRDRTITETVNAAVRELQRGSSFMGGIASSAGGSGGANLGVLGLGAAVGNSWSMGGSTSTSEGSREIAAESIQRVADSFSQASSVQREINSTVVIQARQEQSESIQTRTFSNYNHSHTLTILYYEVLRHFRVTVEWVRRRRAVLARLPKRIQAFDAAALMKHRLVLERALLDPQLKPGFDALEKRESIRNHQAVLGIVPGTKPPSPWWEGDVELEMFEIGIWTNDDTIKPVVVYIITANEPTRSKRYELHYVYKGSGSEQYDAHNINSGSRMATDQEQYTFLKIAGQQPDQESIRVKWSEIVGFQFEKWGDTDWRIDHLSIRAWDRFGFFVELTPEETDVNLFIKGSQPGSQAFSRIKPPSPRPPDPPVPMTPEASLSAEESWSIKHLQDHIAAHIDYYATQVQFGTDLNSIAIEFEKKPWPPSTMDDHVEPTPLDIFGSYVAYPLAAREGGIDDTVVVDIAAALNGEDAVLRQQALARLAAMSDADRAFVLGRLPLASAKSERLISMPTRGVFAEGKLGHCNVSERIDDTRFWKWEEHPLPILAPEIAPTTPISPSPQPVNIAPTPFPAAIVNIAQPTAAPDPGGLAAALGILGKADIFRDMSGRAEVAKLLQELSDNTISIAEAANKAREIQAKYGTDLDKQQKEYDKTIAELASKAREADATRQPPLPGTKAAAEAKKAEVEAAVMQAEAAKKLPADKQDKIYEAVAQMLAPNPVKNKVVLFRAVAFDGQQPLEGEFSLTVRDMGVQRDVVTEAKIGASFGKQISFQETDPVLVAQATRLGAATVKIAGETITFLPAPVAIADALTVGAHHRAVEVTLAQGKQEVAFEVETYAQAKAELMSRWGLALGVAQQAVDNIVTDYEQKHSIVHVAGRKDAYKFVLPSQAYQLSIVSR